MPTIGIILCETLELEFAYLLARDNSVSSISVLSGLESERFIKALELNGVKEVCKVPHLNSFHYEPTRQICVLAKVLPMKLHGSRNLLKKAIYDAAQQISRHTDALFLGYGICGTGCANSDFFKEIVKPVFMLNEKHNPVDDCIGLALGGRKRYYAEQCKSPGTFYVTSGWAHHWHGMFEHDTNKSEHDAIKKMFGSYKRVLLIKSPIMPQFEMEKYIADLIKLLNVTVETQEGTLELLVKSWDSVKESMKWP